MMYILIVTLWLPNGVQHHQESIWTLEQCVEKAEYYRAKFPDVVRGVTCVKE